ncbi:hypothetical protein ACG04R_20145 [Roseateles sp. BYS78W]|uniref:Uncharacterized protein n=1 Tax=Pelomonas candidula TaxID=3299025 RepID=A0ABW7HGX0_9BURK
MSVPALESAVAHSALDEAGDSRLDSLLAVERHRFISLQEVIEFICGSNGARAASGGLLAGEAQQRP